jgi:hypothetical protein
MAFKLTKEETNRLEELREPLKGAFEELERAVNDYNDAEVALRAPVESALNAYNEKLAEFKTFIESVAAERRNEFDEKSESWQDGDNGQAVDEWINNWENIDLEDGNIKFPEEDLSIDFENAADAELPTEP